MPCGLADIPRSSANDAPSADASGACSPTAPEKAKGGNGPEPKHVVDLRVCLGEECLPEGWDYMCSEWVLRFKDREAGKKTLRDLIAVEADRVRAKGKRKGGPRLAEYLSRKMNDARDERESYR